MEKQTKKISVRGSVLKEGQFDVEEGTTIRSLIEDFCGGVTNNKKLKAFQIGNKSEFFLPADLDTVIEFSDPKSIGTRLTKAALVVYSETDSIFEASKKVIDEICELSCGKCTPCRVGTKRMQEIYEKIIAGSATGEEIEKLEYFAEYVHITALCKLGKDTSNVVASAFDNFKNEFDVLVTEVKND